jgi:hypothetical protein
MNKILRTVSRALPKARSLTAQPLTPTITATRTLTTTTAKMGSIPTTTAPATKANADTFLSLIQNRRSIYPLNKTLPIPNSRVQTIISEALQAVPSSFNSQSNRTVVLFGAEHDKLWDVTADILKAIVPADAWEATAGKMAMFKAAAGTALFFEDQTVVEGMQARFPLYADRYVSFRSFLLSGFDPFRECNG